jgi:hypothetical protein
MSAQVPMVDPDIKVRVHEGGTIWSVIATAIAIFGMTRLVALAPSVLEWFFSEECLQVTDNPLTIFQAAVVVGSGIVAIALGEYGARRAGNRIVGMVASVIGVVVVLGGIALTVSLATPSVACGN